MSKAGGPESTRRILKAWVMMGHSMRNKNDHVNERHKKLLLIALRDNHFMTESELDAIAATTVADTVEAPFHEVPTSSSCIATSSSSKSSAHSHSNILGKRADTVPEEIHNEMTSLAREGKLPITTLTQRQRKPD